jgi:hypothetical protein
MPVTWIGGGAVGAFDVGALLHRRMESCVSQPGDGTLVFVGVLLPVTVICDKHNGMPRFQDASPHAIFSLLDALSS